MPVPRYQLSNADDDARLRDSGFYLLTHFPLIRILQGYSFRKVIGPINNIQLFPNYLRIYSAIFVPVWHWHCIQRLKVNNIHVLLSSLGNGHFQNCPEAISILELRFLIFVKI
jgi:hypothetical protein